MNEDYAIDKNHVYRSGSLIEKADPKTFVVLSENGYSKDLHYVFLDNEVVIFANPNTFQVIQWPYSKDDQRIFNGTLPMDVDDVRLFEVIKSSEGRSYTSKSYFVRLNSDYEWLDTLDINTIIVDELAESKTKTQRFKGFRQIE